MAAWNSIIRLGRKRGYSYFHLLFLGVLILLMTGCASPGSTDSTQYQVSHGSEMEPDYATVFPQETVNRIDITLSADAWAALQVELEDQFGAQGEGGGVGVPGRVPGNQGGLPTFPQDQQPPAGMPTMETGDFPAGEMPGRIPGAMPGGVGGMGGMEFGETSYVTSTITFNGETWESVGFRYSGNSTLQTSWRSGTLKISFRLDFDEFEDEDPTTEDQRFYGFKQISFKSNAMDDSYIREKVAADIFRESGVVSSQTAFYEVYIDYGEGSQYFGLYTAVEIVDDTVIETQFSDDGGNVYKPDGTGATFAEGTFNEGSFEKQTNVDEADWSDIQAVFSALHSSLRTSDAAAWRTGLEAVFDVQAFLRWLAVDTIIQNWDTYGSMSHNYYLYTDPEDGLVTWIPWDNNMALSPSAAPGNLDTRARFGGGGGRGGGVRELDLRAVSEQWPLIRFLMDDPVYQEQYRQYLQETIEGEFQPEKLAARYQAAHDLIAPYVAREVEGFTQLESLESFEQSLDELRQHALERYEAIVEYLEIKP